MPVEDKEIPRSTYGLKTYTPEETKNQWKEYVHRQRLIHQRHSFSKGQRDLIEEMKSADAPIEEISYFNNNKQHCLASTYDRQFHIEHGYHSKLARDDRKKFLGLNVNAEEVGKDVPILSSSVYGHRAPLEQPARKFCRVALVQRDFYRDWGTNIFTNIDA